MKQANELLEKIVLGEIEGKNRAIHAYDGMGWKIRTGFLTLLFGGWAILLKGIVDAAKTAPQGEYTALGWRLLLFSLGFAFEAWLIDRSYLKLSPELLKVAGDSADMPYDSRGYREAAKAELSVYLIPLVILVAVIVLVVR